MLKNTFLLTCLLSVWLIQAGAQNVSGETDRTQSVFPRYTPTILPPTPDAYAFTKYGNLPIGLNTGTAQFSVPVYTIQSGQLSHSVSLAYNSNGVKVDELATRVGINWNLKAGGVITRTVLDKPDGAPGVQRTFYHGNSSSTSNNWDLYNHIRQASYATAPDFQPDEYAYNVDGYSGKFIRRENGEWTQLTASGMKIEQAAGGFVLTSPEGNRYVFNVTEVSRNYSYPETPTLSWVPSPVVTAWYLTKIYSPFNDSITFHYNYVGDPVNPTITYTTGISQDYSTITNQQKYYRIDYNGVFFEGAEYGPNDPHPPGLQTLVQLSDNQPVYLSRIDFEGGSLQLAYSGRQDMPAEKKIDSIKVFRSADQTLIRCMVLQHIYASAAPNTYNTFIAFNNYTDAHPELRKRLFLSGVDELSTDLQLKNSFTFEYDDINALPPRLSFSQDRYGSFNSKVNPLYYIPNDTWFDHFLGYNHFGADRTYHFPSARKGMLMRVNYPTGGYTTFGYEPNRLEANYAYVYVRDSTVVTIDTSTHTGQQALSASFDYNPVQKSLRWKGTCQWASVPISTVVNGVAVDVEEAYYVAISLINVSTNSCVKVCNQTIRPGESFMDGTFGNDLPAGTYRIQLTANRPHFWVRVVAERFSKEWDRSANAGICGVRVGSVTDYTREGQQAKKRSFLYGNWGDPASSSGTGLNVTDNNGSEVSWTRMLARIYGGDPGKTFYTGYNTIHSNSTTTNYASENNTVLYTRVIELVEEGVKNMGGTEYEFYYDRKKTPIPFSFLQPNFVWEPHPMVPGGTPQMNNDYRTGLQKSMKQFTYQQAHGSRTIQQEEEHYYSVDTGQLQIDTFYVSKHVLKMESEVPEWIYYTNYDMGKYWRYYGFLKLDSTVRKVHDGSTTLTSATAFKAYSPRNYQPVDIEQRSSNGVVTRQTRKYACDYAPGQSGYGVYQMLTQQNRLNQLIEERQFAGGTELFRKRVAMASQSGTNYLLPSALYASRQNGPEDLELSYQLYDGGANLLQYREKKGVTTAVIRGYDRMYPVAQVVGAKAGEVLYTGFESSDLTGWSPALTSLDDSRSFTGKRSGYMENYGSGEQVAHSTTRLNVSLTAPRKFRYSGWVYSDGPSVDIFLFMNRAGESGYFSYVDHVSTTATGKWVYLEKDFEVPADVRELFLRLDNNGGGKVWFDEVRLHPSNAQMTTFTYDPLIGMTSQSDANNRPVYYEYDRFNRLRQLRDQDRNVIKVYDYQYQKPAASN